MVEDRRCGYCEERKPLGEFMRLRGGWKATYCNSCAAANMAKWEAQSAQQRKAMDEAVRNRVLAK